MKICKRNKCPTVVVGGKGKLLKRNRFPYIIAWGKMLRWSSTYLQYVLAMATEESAPERAVYKRAAGTWCIVDECDKVVRDYIKKLAGE